MMFAREPLTRRQAEILAFVRDHITQRGYAPTLAEIGHRFQLRSLATVHKHTENLRAKGYIRRRWNFSRSLEIVDIGAPCPHCGKPMGNREETEKQADEC